MTCQHRPSPRCHRSRRRTLPKLAGPLKTDAAKKELGRIVPYCAPAVAIDGKVERVGCACCPPFVQCPPKATSELVEQSEVFPLRGKLDGTFSGTGEDELALTFAGCEAHVDNWGGTLLVEKNDPKKSTYRTGVNPDECKKLHDPKRNIDRLLCQRRDGHQGISHTFVFVYELSKKPTMPRCSCSTPSTTR